MQRHNCSHHFLYLSPLAQLQKIQIPRGVSTCLHLNPVLTSLQETAGHLDCMQGERVGPQRKSGVQEKEGIMDASQAKMTDVLCQDRRAVFSYTRVMISF